MNTQNLETYHKEVTRKYVKAGKKLSAEKERYLKEKMYRTRYKLYTMDDDAYERMIENGFSFSDRDSKAQAKVWSHIFKKTDYMGVGHLAINHFRKLQKNKKRSMIEYWPEMKTWVGSIENWAHGDMIASVYSRMLEEDPKKVYPTLVQWSRAKSPWKRRMSLVSLLYYYSCRRSILPYAKIIALLEPQLESDHYYLQKAVGWTLRELWQAYPKETWNFLQKNSTRISSTAFSAAVEKVPSIKKEKLKDVRKRFRISKRLANRK